MAKTIEELVQQYNQDAARQQEEFKAIAVFNQDKPKEERKPYKNVVNYGEYERLIGEAIKEEFHLTDAQTGVVMAKAYEQYHAYFGDMFHGARELAQFAVEFAKAA